MLSRVLQQLYSSRFYLLLSALRHYQKNKSVFKSILPLAQSVRYFSEQQQAWVDESQVLNLLQQGDVIKVPNLLGAFALQTQFEQLTQDFFQSDLQALSKIHQKLSIDTLVQQAKAARYSALSLQLQSSIMYRLLRVHSSKVYLELQPNLRLHLPYSLIKGHETYIEREIGRGKLNPHGQHKDSWRGHPKNTINMWLALTEATAQNGMGILLNSLDYHPKHDAEGQEIQRDVKTYPSQHYVTNLQPGDMLLFMAELLHGSVINQSPDTRVALSMRCSVEKPQFHQDYRYNYIGIEHGRFTNLTFQKSLAKHWFVPESSQTSFEPAEKKQTGITPVFADQQRIDIQWQGELKSFPRYCPHAGADLLLGELSADGDLLCPSHRFCVKASRDTNEQCFTAELS